MSRRRAKPRPRAEIKQATHEALVAAAIHEFGEHGLDASLDAICARAGLTRGAFYVHFADREALIVAAMHRVLGDFVRTLAGTAPVPASVADAARGFFGALRRGSAVVRGGRGLRFHHVMEACRRSKQLGDTYRMLVLGGRDQLARQVTADQQAARVRGDVSAAALADLLVIVALGAVTAYELDLAIDADRLATTALAVLSG